MYVVILQSLRKFLKILSVLHLHKVIYINVFLKITKQINT